MFKLTFINQKQFNEMYYTLPFPTITDFALALGGSMSDDYYDKEKNIFRYAGEYWTKTAIEEKHCPFNIDINIGKYFSSTRNPSNDKTYE